MADDVLYNVDDGIGILKINRPRASNALNWAAQEKFAKTVNAAQKDRELRVIIITGEGNKVFASGGDLKELSSNPNNETRERLNRVMSAALAQLTKIPVPVIAAINGDAVGGGCEIVTACDIRMSASNAHFRFAQVNMGLTTGWGGTGRLVQILGTGQAMEILLSGRKIDAEEALKKGLLHQIVSPGEDVVARARILALELVSLPRLALASTKRLVWTAGETLAHVNQLEASLFNELWLTSDHLEAMEAFIQKRLPKFNRPS